MVAIINYGMGNLASVKKAMDFLDIDAVITSDLEQISDANSIILPGVGSFKQGMQNLKELGLIPVLTEQVMTHKKPFLGICLGMQLIFKKGTEPSDCDGLGWIAGKVVKFENQELRIPHMGWNSLSAPAHSFLKKYQNKDVYFIHSYHAVPDDKSVIAATTNYGFDVVAGVEHNNIFATQFHPEKSQEVGLAMLENFFLHYAKV